MVLRGILRLVVNNAAHTVTRGDTAGVGQDVQDVANFTRNKIVEKVNAHQRQGLSQEEIDAVSPDFISPDNFEGSGGAPPFSYIWSLALRSDTVF